jgi:hypothetical protein
MHAIRKYFPNEVADIDEAVSGIEAIVPGNNECSEHAIQRMAGLR